MYPYHRMRRMRMTENRRKMIQENVLTTDRLVFPVLVVPGMDKEDIDDLGPFAAYSVDRLYKLGAELLDLGITAMYIKGVPESKDEVASEAHSGAGTVQRAIRAIKRAHPDLVIVTDLSLAPYTDTGYGGIVEAGVIHNEATVEVVQRMALSHVGCGADFLAPVSMMDGQVTLIRQALEEHGYDEVGILAGTAVYASAFGDRPLSDGESVDRSGEHLMDPANASEALRQTAMSIEEGAEMALISPGLTNLDIIHRVKDTFQVPVVTLAGDIETAMLKHAAASGMINEDLVMTEALVAQIRAGADLLITPFARQVAKAKKDA